MEYYCKPLKKHVIIYAINYKGYFDTLMISCRTGEVLLDMAMPFFSTRKYCCYLNDVDNSWLGMWLSSNEIAVPTHRVYSFGTKTYKEYKFKKEKIIL